MGFTLLILCSMFIFIHSSAGLQCYSCTYINITDPAIVPNEFTLRAISQDACQPGKTPPREFIKLCESSDSNNVVACTTITAAISTYAVIYLRSCLKVPNDNTQVSDINPSSNPCRKFSQAELLQFGASLEHAKDITEATICACTENCTSEDKENAKYGPITDAPSTTPLTKFATTHTNVKEPLSKNFNLLWILTPVCIIILVLLVLAFVLVLRRHIKSQKQKPHHPNALTASSKSDRTNNRYTRTESKPLGENSIHMSSIMKYELLESSFSLDETKILGSGEFGQVCLGKVFQDGFITEVAVKMLKRTSDDTALQGMVSEIKLLSQIGHHGNIISLVGAYTQKLDAGIIYVFLEFCPRGSLEKVLRNTQPHMSVTAIEYDVFRDLHRWAIEISTGMEFLASKRLLHADLATRNVLLDSQNIAKISDFGLSRRLYNYTCYVKQQIEPLPWRWMAPESLRRLEFTEKTDVWAFGVTLWEIYTFADIPYPGLTWVPNFVSHLENGLRLDKPKYDQMNMYELMTQCWNIDPEKRPRFSQIRHVLNDKQYTIV